MSKPAEALHKCLACLMVKGLLVSSVLVSAFMQGLSHCKKCKPFETPETPNKLHFSFRLPCRESNIHCLFAGMHIWP